MTEMETLNADAVRRKVLLGQISTAIAKAWGFSDERAVRRRVAKAKLFFAKHPEKLKEHFTESEIQSIFKKCPDIASEQMTLGDSNTADSENGQWITSDKTQQFRTIEEVLDEAEIDRKLWVVKRAVINKWEMGAKNEQKDLTFKEGVKDGSESASGVVVTPLWQVKIWLEPRDTTDKHVLTAFENMIETIRREAVENAVYAPRHYMPAVLPSARNLFEVAPVDMHFGKYAEASETPAGFDLEDASNVFRWGIEELIRKAAVDPIERILYIVGNDLMHFDTVWKTTWKGTPMDVSAHYQTVFNRVHELKRWSINRLLEIAPVDILIVPGNHDMQSAFCIGEVLKGYYHNNQHVSIDNTPKTRKYYPYGETLLGFTHGSEEKMDMLPGLMAKEAKHLWAKANWHEWHIGHKHKAQERRFTAGDSFAGTRVRILSTLTAHDKWHHQQGWHDRRSSDAFIWNHETAFSAHYSANIVRS